MAIRREAKIAFVESKVGVKWAGGWKLPSFRHDVHSVAIASGPGVTDLHWPIAKPYQPTSPRVNRRVIGATGAVWIDGDGDGDGKRSSAYAYAQRLLKAHGPQKVIATLSEYDEAVAVQVASSLRARGISLDIDAARKAGDHVARGFLSYAEAYRECEVARAKTP
jgi:hypothetical protein